MKTQTCSSGGKDIYKQDEVEETVTLKKKSERMNNKNHSIRNDRDV